MASPMLVRFDANDNDQMELAAALLLLAAGKRDAARLRAERALKRR